MRTASLKPTHIQKASFFTRRCHASSSRSVFTIVASETPSFLKPDGSAVSIDVASTLVEKYATLEYKSNRLFITASSSDDDSDDNLLSLMSPSNTSVWINGTEIRPNVAYMVSPDTTIAVGSIDNTLVAQFKESGSAGGLDKILMQGMLQSASPEVQKQMNDLQ